MLNIHLLIGILISLVSISLGYKLGKKDGELSGVESFLEVIRLYDDTGELMFKIKHILSKVNSLSLEEYIKKATKKMLDENK